MKLLTEIVYKIYIKQLVSLFIKLMKYQFQDDSLIEHNV